MSNEDPNLKAAQSLTGIPAPTCVRLLTARAPAAIAVIQLEGPAAQQLIDMFWMPASSKRSTELNAIRYGSWQSHSFDRRGIESDQVSEDVVLCWKHEDCVEVHCHGGPVASNRILNDLVHGGAVQVLVDASKPSVHGVKVQAVELNDTAHDTAHDIAHDTAHDKFKDIAHRVTFEAWEDLTHATTELTTAILLDQARGELEKAILRVLDQMQSHHIDDALQEIDQLILRSIYGARLLTGWRIGIVGPPNAGKSSFLNRILGYTRAIVHDTPGTTRDLLRERTSILGWPIEFIDTAGIRETECGVEAEGVCRAMGVLEECDLILLLVDPTQGVVKLHLQILEDYESKVLVIATKEDLFTADCNQASVQRALRHSHSLQTISSSMNLGIDEVLQKIIDRLVLQEVRFGRAVPFREDQIQVLQELRGKLISRKLN